MESPVPTVEQLPPAPRAQVSAMLVGEWQTAECAAVSRALETMAKIDCAAGIDDACVRLGKCEQPPDLILVAQPLPGDCTRSDVDRLSAIVPLTRIVVVAGSWCEGELRTGSPPAGVVRLYWHEVDGWWRAALRRYRAGQCPPWSLPLDHPTAGRWSSAGDDLTTSQTCRVVIDACDFATFEALACGLAAYDITATWSRNADEYHKRQAGSWECQAGIWDGGQLSAAEQRQLAGFCQRIDGPVTALLDYPRREHVGLAQQLGASTVLGKPYVLEEVASSVFARD